MEETQQPIPRETDPETTPAEEILPAHTPGGQEDLPPSGDAPPLWPDTLPDEETQPRQDTLPGEDILPDEDALPDEADPSDGRALPGKGAPEKDTPHGEGTLPRQDTLSRQDTLPRRDDPSGRTPPADPDYRGQVRRLLDRYPGVRTLPDEVLRACARDGRELVEAYETYRARQPGSPALAIQRQNEAGRRRAPVTGVGPGAFVPDRGEDDFLRGFNSDY